jgi:hypothetical protein
MQNPKFQAPNPKQIQNFNHPMFETLHGGRSLFFDIGYWNLFGIWFLMFGAYSYVRICIAFPPSLCYN